MMLAGIVINGDWSTAYNSVVLTIIAVSQIYLDFAIVASQRRNARERRTALAKEKAALEEASKQVSGEHEAVKP